VNVDTFTDAMTAHWSRLGNTVSPELRSIWSKLCVTLNAQVLQWGTHEGDRWRVFPAELGSGKTEGLKVYCTLLPADDSNAWETTHPGVLIIVRLKAQADEIAEDIDHWTRRDTAFAYHGDTAASVKLADLAKYPVLVITHAAYERGLEALNRNKVDHFAKWKHLHAWGVSGRKLIVVDESLDLIREERATLRNLRHLRGVMPEHIQVKYKAEVKALDEIIATLSAFADRKKRERTANPLSPPALVDFGPLWMDLKANTRWPSSLILGDPNIPGSAENARRRFFRLLKITLSGAQALLERWYWYFYKLGDHTLTTAWFLLPDEGIQGAVILDATAERNHLYKLFADKFEIVTVPSARTYREVRHIYVYAEKTGRDGVMEQADEIVREMVGNLQTHYGPKHLPHRSVLFLTHLAVEPFVMKWAKEAGFKEVAVGHWNALDGRNDWNHFNTVVVLSQPYRDPATPANIFQAVYGPQSSEWLNNPKLRKWREFDDILSALETSHLVVSNAQGINRARCRRVVDERGNCQPVDVFSRLPKRGGSDIIAGLKLAMPEIQQAEWKRFAPAAGLKATSLTPSYDEALIACAETLRPGYTKATHVRDDLGISSRQWDRLVGDMRNETTALFVRLEERGVKYMVERVGKTQVAYLHKATTERDNE
jgi:hypothetical protein